MLSCSIVSWERRGSKGVRGAGMRVGSLLARVEQSQIFLQPDFITLVLTFAVTTAYLDSARFDPSWSGRSARRLVYASDIAAALLWRNQSLTKGSTIPCETSEKLHVPP